MLKQSLVRQLRDLLTAELETLLRATAAAREAATHAESKPENKYDTRGLEASYLAGAQAERAAELQGAIQILDAVVIRVFSVADKISTTALVTVDRDGDESQYFVMPVGGGARFVIDGAAITVVTPQAPMGKLLVGKSVGDVVTLEADGSDIEILALR